MQILEYLAAGGASSFARWFDALDAQAAAKVTVALQRMRQGNFANVKGVGAGVLEYRIDFGARLSTLLRTRRGADHSFAWRRDQASPTAGHRNGACVMARLPPSKREIMMPLTREFKTTVKARAERDAAFREAL